MEDLNKTVSQRLQNLFNGETDAMVASKLNMSPANLNKIRNGKQAPTAEVLKLISQKYNVSVDWILGIKDDPDINALDMNTLSYEQVFGLINQLYEMQTVEVANMGTNKQPRMDSDYLKVNDPVLSFMLRRRVALIGVDKTYFEDWIEKHLPQYKGVPLLICNSEMLNYFQDVNISNFTEGDWVSKINDYIQQKEEENKNNG